MAIASRLVADRTDLSAADLDLLGSLAEQWSLIADLALSDLVLWVPTWNDGGLVAVAQVRPTTAPTCVPADVVGDFVPRGRVLELDRAVAMGRPVASGGDGRPDVFPVLREGTVVGLVARHRSMTPRVAGRLEEVYLATADDLLVMLVEGGFPVRDAAAAAAPRVGDGLVRLAEDGAVEFASPNATSALRRLGVSSDVVGAHLDELMVRLARRTGVVDEALSAVASGRFAGRADIETPTAVVVVRGIPLIRAARRVGSVLFLADVTDVRRRERALVTKEATIREMHHRVKNNLQTVAAMLRLQARRVTSEEARDALAEAEMRVAAIAVVHDTLSAEEGESIDFDVVVDRIVALVRDLAAAFPGPIPEITRVGSWGSVSADAAIPLAMVASELLHNAVEHAGARTVEVRLQLDDAARTLVVADDGTGLADDHPTGLGLSIVDSLATGDLGGTFVMRSDAVNGRSPAGTVAAVRVPRAD